MLVPCVETFLQDTAIAIPLYPSVAVGRSCHAPSDMAALRERSIKANDETYMSNFADSILRNSIEQADTARK